MTEPAKTEPATWAVRPISVHVPPGEWRSPGAKVRMAEKVLPHITKS